MGWIVYGGEMLVLIVGLLFMLKILLFFFSIRVYMSMSLCLFIFKLDGLLDYVLVIYIVENLKYIVVMY